MYTDIPTTPNSAMIFPIPVSVTSISNILPPPNREAKTPTLPTPDPNGYRSRSKKELKNPFKWTATLPEDDTLLKIKKAYAALTVKHKISGIDILVRSIYQEYITKKAQEIANLIEEKLA